MKNRWWMLAAIALIGAACDSPVDPGPGKVQQVVVDPAARVLSVGDTFRVNARATTAQGEPVEANIFWSTEADWVASVEAQGASALIEAKRPGTTRIAAEAEGRVGRTVITVVAQPTPSPVAEVVLTPASGSLAPGEEVTVRAEPRAADGTPLEGRAITWMSTNPSVLSVAAGASPDVVTVRAEGVGDARVEATSEGVVGGADFEVAEPAPVAYVIVSPERWGVWKGSMAAFQVKVLGATGGELTGRSVQVWVEDTDIATLDGERRVVGGEPGVTRIFAESEGVQGSASVYVYELTRQVTLQLTYDWWDGEIRPMHAVGTTQWTDDQGTVRNAVLYAVDGIFSIDFDAGTWRYVLAAEAYAVVDGEQRTVGAASYAEEGTFAYRWNSNGSISFTFVVSDGSGEVYLGHFRQGGQLQVGLPVTGGIMGYLFRIGG